MLMIEDDPVIEHEDETRAHIVVVVSVVVVSVFVDIRTSRAERTLPDGAGQSGTEKVIRAELRAGISNDRTNKR